jgi:hypothetical protein
MELAIGKVILCIIFPDWALPRRKQMKVLEVVVAPDNSA